MKNWRKILYPFSLLYGSVMALRNVAFNRKLLPSKGYSIPVIAVGNLSTGGTGKTPMTEYLIELFGKKHKIGVVSRGYGRKTKGLLEAKPGHTSHDIGDEPLQMFTKFSNIKLAVSEKRQLGIDYLLNKYPDLQLILLDDAYQHRYVKAGFYILLTSFSSPFYKDLVLPAGNLREFPSGRKRADLVVVTKCSPDLKIEEAKKIERKIDHPLVLFSSLDYAEPISVSGDRVYAGKEIMVISGIAQPQAMLDYLQKNYTLVKHYNYPDHYPYNQKDLKDWQGFLEANPAVSVITTEKDWSRLRNILIPELYRKTFILPVKTHFLFDGRQQLTEAISPLLSPDK